MQSICQHCEIEFDECLLQPSKAGESWSGNSTTDAKFEGISDARVKAWKTQIHPVDIHIINHLYGKILDQFGYERLDPGGSIFSRFQGESASRYVYNRLFWMLSGSNYKLRA